MKYIIGLLILVCTATHAEWIPKKPIITTVANIPGSGAAISYIPVQKRLNDLNHKNIVDYVAGAEGIVGANKFRSNAQPDGYSLLLFTRPQFVYADLLYKKEKQFEYTDFIPVTLIGKSSLVLFTNPQYSNVNSIADIVNHVKFNKVNIGSSASDHALIWKSIFNQHQLNLNFINYKAPPQQIIDLLSNDLQYGTAPLSVALQFHQDKKIKIIAVTDNKRDRNILNIPTVSETIKNFKWNVEWGIALPKNTPDDIVLFYEKTISNIVLSPSVQQWYNERSINIMPSDTGQSSFKSLIETIRKDILQ